jgi:isopenicillin-N epimerase
MSHSSRRNFIKTAGLTLSALGSSSLTAESFATRISATQDSSLPKRPPLSEIATNEAYWNQVANQYQISDEIINLENGYWGIMSKPVLKDYIANTQKVNHRSTLFARTEWWTEFMGIRRQVADFLNVKNSEVALTRGATEALQVLIGGYNKLKPGDKVLYADLDYSEMKNAFRWLEQRRGVEVIKVNFPEPANWDNVIELYKQTFEKHPEIKLMLLTHLNNWTGLINPVKQISKIARTKGIDIILDAAHSVGHVEFDIKELGCDFVGVNLHKWVGAPIGCGAVIINESRIADIEPYMGKNHSATKPNQPANILDRIDTGTANFAAYLSIPSAIKFHNQISTKAKQLRLKYLRDTWVEQLRNEKGIQILTPDDHKQVAALTSFRLNNQTSTKANNEITKQLAKQHGILTVRRTGPALGDCVRVTPSIYNTPEQMQRLATALKSMV